MILTLFTEMNTLMMQMRHTAHELRVTLDHVLQGGEAAVTAQNSQDETVSFLNEPEAEMRAVHNIPEVSTTAQCWDDCTVLLNFAPVLKFS